MKWNELKQKLSQIGLINFESREHFENWRKWENDNLQLEKKIAAILCDN